VIGWILNGEPLIAQNSLAIQIDSNSLLISNVSKRHVGEYQCWAESPQGKGESEIIPLNVHCTSFPTA